MNVEKCCLDCKYGPDLGTNFRLSLCVHWADSDKSFANWGLGFIGPRSRPFINCDDWAKKEEEAK